MTNRSHWKLFVCVLGLSGCQTASEFLPWQMSGQPTYTADELAALNDPQPAATKPQLTESMQASNVRTVGLTSETPVAAGRIDQLITAGQAAIREAGQARPGKLLEAKQNFQQVLSMDAENSSAHHGMAIVADLQKDWANAELHYKQALQQRPRDPSLLNDLGYSYLLQDRFHEASQYLNQAIQLAPQHERAHINLALLSLKRGDRHGAEARLAGIYTSPEISATLNRLEQDLMKTAAPNVMTASAQSPNARTAAQPAPPQNFTQARPIVQTQASNAGPPQFERPIHVYPPGVIPEPLPTDQPSGMPDHGQPGSYGSPSQTAAYPGAAPQGFQPGITMPQQMQQGRGGTGPGNYPTQQGVPVGGVIASPSPNSYSGQPQGNPQGTVPGVNPANYQNGYGSMPQSGSPQYNGMPAVSNQAPVAGLNAGSGILFPIGTAGQTQAAPGAASQQATQAAGSYPGQQNYGPPASRYQSPQNGANSAAYQSHAMPHGNVTSVSATQNYPSPGGLVSSSGLGSASQSYAAGAGYPNGSGQMAGAGQQGLPSQQTQSAMPGQYAAPQPRGQQTQYGQQGQYGQAGQQGQYAQYGQAGQAGQQGQYGPPQPAAAGGGPLTEYEQQLQQLNSQYNQALQQLDGRNSAMSPAPPRY
ncbi:MAG: tetratricopeptide repeat protein [Fuerstiella sp.]